MKCHADNCAREATREPQGVPVCDLHENEYDRMKARESRDNALHGTRRWINRYYGLPPTYEPDVATTKRSTLAFCMRSLVAAAKREGKPFGKE